MNNFYESGSFKEDLDKVTEAEMVYNILERLKFGNDITLSTFVDRDYQGLTIYPENTKLINAIRHILISAVPPSLLEYTDNMKAVIMEIPQGAMFASSGFVLDNSSDRYTIVKAFSEKARLDVTSIVGEPEYQGYNCSFSLSFDTAYPYDDNIVIYLKKTN